MNREDLKILFQDVINDEGLCRLVRNKHLANIDHIKEEASVFLGDIVTRSIATRLQFQKENEMTLKKYIDSRPFIEYSEQEHDTEIEHSQTEEEDCFIRAVTEACLFE
jgi:hypothetical protein